MADALFDLLIFSSKALIVVLLILLLLAGILMLLSRGKEKTHGRITIKNLNHRYAEITQNLLSTILSKKAFKEFLKSKKTKERKEKKHATEKNIYLINFEGDIKASAVASLREEVNAILNIATPKDEVVVRLESAGGIVHSYGLAAAQLIRIRDKKIPLTVTIDKIAASGGYLMAAVANKIYASSFATIGSIGVVAQLPNFHRFLKDKHIDFEQVTAGNYKRTITLFGENTKEGREKLKEEVSEIHTLFKNLIQEYRPGINIEKVATGEVWPGKQAMDLDLVDHLGTSDDYLMEKCKSADVYEIRYLTKKSFAQKFTNTAQAIKETLGTL